jgi:hypothetical protein
LPVPGTRAEVIAFLKSSDPLRRGGGVASALAILTGGYSKPDLPADEVARDLVELATSDAPQDVRGDAVAALAMAGRPPDGARPYPGAAARLMEVFRGSPDVGIRGVAMTGIAHSASKPVALAFFAPIAESTDPKLATEQSAAINAIAQLDTPESIAFLRKLDESGTVRNHFSLMALKRAAAGGYRLPPPQR